MNTYCAVTLGAGLMATLLTWVVIRLCREWDLLDVPGVRKVHANPTPRLGGAAIVVAVLAMSFLVFVLDNRIGDAFRANSWEILALLSGAVFLFLVGVVDDIRGLGAFQKLVAQVAAAVWVCMCGITIDEISIANEYTIAFGAWSWPVTILWIVGLTNALNLIDGLDGLAAGIALIAGVVLSVFAIMSNQPVMAVLMLALVGSLAGFLVFNFNPAKVFMGDCGSLFLGFLLGAGSALCATETVMAGGLGATLVALGIPVLDMVFSIVRRILERRSPFAPDNNHIHHRLLQLGLHHRDAVFVLWLTTVAAAGLGAFMIAGPQHTTIAVFVIAMIGVASLFRLAGVIRVRASARKLWRNLSIARETHRDRHSFEEAQLWMRAARCADSWWQAVCLAAEKLGFAQLKMILASDDDETRATRVWSNPLSEPADQLLMQLTVPLSCVAGGGRGYLEAAIGAGCSLESAGRKGAFLIRLIDESNPPALPEPHGTASSKRLVELPTGAEEVASRIPEPGSRRVGKEIM